MTTLTHTEERTPSNHAEFEADLWPWESADGRRALAPVHLAALVDASKAGPFGMVDDGMPAHWAVAVRRNQRPGTVVATGHRDDDREHADDGPDYEHLCHTASLAGSAWSAGDRVVVDRNQSDLSGSRSAQTGMTATPCPSPDEPHRSSRGSRVYRPGPDVTDRGTAGPHTAWHS